MIAKNLLINKIDISSLNIDCVQFEHRFVPDFDIATIKLNNDFVKVATVTSNCSTVFIFENTFNEYFLNLLFKTGGFTGAFSTTNLFEKSIKINDEVYFLPFKEKMYFKYYNINLNKIEKIMSNKISLDIRTSLEKIIEIGDFCFAIRIFDNSDYMLMSSIIPENFNNFIDIIKQYKLFGVYYRKFYKNFKPLFKNALNYKSVRTKNNLCVLTT